MNEKLASTDASRCKRHQPACVASAMDRDIRAEMAGVPGCFLALPVRGVHKAAAGLTETCAGFMATIANAHAMRVPCDKFCQRARCEFVRRRTHF
jgi:hypothetical protein